MKNKSCNIIFMLLFMVGVQSWAKDLMINEVRITKMAVAAGTKVTAFYVNGREPSIGTVGHRLQVVEVIGEPIVAVVDSSKTVVFPTVSIPRRAGFVNYIQFVIHKSGQYEVSIRNPDGKWVADARNVANPAEGQQYGQISILKLSLKQPDPKVPVEISAVSVFNGQ